MKKTPFILLHSTDTLFTLKPHLFFMSRNIVSHFSLYDFLFIIRRRFFIFHFAKQ